MPYDFLLKTMTNSTFECRDECLNFAGCFAFNSFEESFEAFKILIHHNFQS